MKYELVDYDVWGNNREGFMINAAYLTGDHIDLTEDQVSNHITLIQALKKRGWLVPELHFKSVAVIGEYPYMIYLEDARQKSFGFPIFELRPVMED